MHIPDFFFTASLPPVFQRSFLEEIMLTVLGFVGFLVTVMAIIILAVYIYTIMKGRLRTTKDKCFDYEKRRTCNGCLVCEKDLKGGGE